MSTLLRSSNPDVQKQERSKIWLICNKNMLTRVLFLSSILVLATILISLVHMSELIPSLSWGPSSDRLLFHPRANTQRGSTGPNSDQYRTFIIKGCWFVSFRVLTKQLLHINEIYLVSIRFQKLSSSSLQPGHWWLRRSHSINRRQGAEDQFQVLQYEHDSLWGSWACQSSAAWDAACKWTVLPLVRSDGCFCPFPVTFITVHLSECVITTATQSIFVMFLCLGEGAFQFRLRVELPFCSS